MKGTCFEPSLSIGFPVFRQEPKYTLPKTNMAMENHHVQ